MATKIKNVVKNISINQAASSVNGTTTVTKNTIYNDVFKVANDIDYVEINSTNNKSSDIIYLQGVKANNPALRVTQETINVDGDVIFTKNLIITYLNKYGLLSTVVIKDYFTTEEGLATNSTIKKIRLQNPDNPSKTVDYNLADGIELRNAMGGSIVGDTVTGTAFSDRISVSGIDGKVVNAGAGDDYIKSGVGNDTITGGSGRTHFVYSEGSGEDTIYLTKGEQLEIEYNSSSPFKGSDFSFEKSGNDVVITRLGVNDKIIIKNAFKAGAKSIAFQAGDLIWDVLNGAYNFYSDGEVPDDPDYSSIVYNNYGKKNVTSKGILNGSSTADEIILADYTNKKKTGVKINAGAGNDSVVSSVYNDTIKAGAGNDTIIAIGGNNKIYGEGGNDEIHISSEKGNNYIDGGAGNDYLTGAKGNDTIKGGSGNDTISEWAGKNALYGGAGNDYIAGGEGNDKMYGDAGNDTIFSYSGNDTIYAGAGNDRVEVITGKNTIYAQKGNNTIYGGKGSDKIYAGSGNDKIYYCVGGGKDTIYNATSKTTLAIYDSNVDLNMRDLTFVKKGNDLIIALKTQGNADGTLKYSDSITIANYYKSKNKISNIEILGRYRNYLPYSEQTLANLMKNQGVYQVGNKVTGINGITNVIVGTSKNDTLNGGNSMDMFAGGKGNDIIKGGKGTTLVQYIAGDGNDTIQLTKGETVQIMYTLDAGTDISSMDEDDIINMFSIKESGKDVIISRKWNNNGKTVTDKIIIKNMTLNNLAQDITMGICDSTNHEITSIDLLEKQYLLQGKASYNKKTKKYSGATINGTNLNEEIVGTDYADTIKAGGGNDDITGGKGNDKLYGGAGSNHYFFTAGDGNDTVYAGSGSNLVHLDGDFEDYNFKRSGNDVIISYKDSSIKDKITIKDYFKNNKDNVTISDKLYERDLLDIIKNFVPTTIDKSSATKKQTITGTLLDETLIGGKAGDLIKSIGGSNLVDGGAGNDTIYGGKWNDDILGGAGNDIIYAGSNGQFINGGSGNDTMYSGNGDNCYELGIDHGNDVIDTKKGANNLMFSGLNLADMKFSKKGNDIIITNKNSKGKDETTTIKNYLKYGKDNVYIQAEDFEASLTDILNNNVLGLNVNFSNVINQSKAKKKQNIVGTLINDKITGSNYNDTIKAGAGDDIVSGGKGNDKIYAQSGNNTIDGGLGNDTIYAGKGSDMIVHLAGQGKDVIYNATPNTIIQIKNINSEESVGYIKSGNDLIIASDAKWNAVHSSFTYKSSVTVKNYFKMENQHIKLRLVLKDGNQLEPSFTDWEIENNGIMISGKGKINGVTEMNNMLVGSTKNDTITFAQNSSNVVTAGKGNDVINAVSNTSSNIIYTQGDGNDIIYVNDNSHVNIRYIATDKTLKENDFKFTQSGDDIIISRSYKVTTKNSKGKKVTKTVTDKITLKNAALSEAYINFSAMTGEQQNKLNHLSNASNEEAIAWAIGKTEAQVKAMDNETKLRTLVAYGDYKSNSSSTIAGWLGISVAELESYSKAEVIDLLTSLSFSEIPLYECMGISKSAWDSYNEAQKANMIQSKINSYSYNIMNNYRNNTYNEIQASTINKYLKNDQWLDSGVNPRAFASFTDKHDALTAQNIQGTDINDFIIGSDYDDKIYAGEGADYIYAGKGDDTILVRQNNGTSSKVIVISNGDGNDTIKGIDSYIMPFDAELPPPIFPMNTPETKLVFDENTTVLKQYKKDEFGRIEAILLHRFYKENGETKHEITTLETHNSEFETEFTILIGDSSYDIDGISSLPDGFVFDDTTNIITLDGNPITGGVNVTAFGTPDDDNITINNEGGTANILDLDGDNTFNIQKGTNNISTGDGLDNIIILNGRNDISTGDGEDNLTISGGQNTINVGDDNDSVSITGGENTVTNGGLFVDVTIEGGKNTINAATGNGIIESTITGGENTIDVTNTLSDGDSYASLNIQGGKTDFTGGGQSDYVTISGGQNIINTGGGADRISIIGGAASDTNDIDTGANNDKIYIDGGLHNTVKGGFGNDEFYITDGNSTLYGGTGADKFTIEGGANTIYAGDDIDTFKIEGGTNTIDGEAGADDYIIEGGTNTINDTGTDIANTFKISSGTNGITTSATGNENYTITGGTNTVERAGYITATISGGENTIYAPTGTINASNGTNHIYARAGESETAQGGTLGATITCGTTYMYAGENDNYANAVSISGGTNHEINTGGGADKVTISGGNDSNNKYVNTGKGADSITLEGGYAYIVDSGADDDVININGGAAYVYAKDGNDKITINSEDSVLIEGGVGNDTIAHMSSIKSGQEVIFTFNNGDGHDVIGDVLNNYITTAEGIKENCALQFKDAEGFSDLDIDIKQGIGAPDLIIRYNYDEETKSYKDSVTIKNYKGTDFYLMFGESGVLHSFSDYVNFIYDQNNDSVMGGGDDIIIPAKEGQTINIDSGKDKIFVTSGNYTLIPSSDANEDTILFAGVNSVSDLTVKLGEDNSIDGTDAIITYKGVDNQLYTVTIKDYKSAQYKVMNLKTKSGETVSLNDLIKPVYVGDKTVKIDGTPFSDSITWTYTGDAVTAINGGLGNDTLISNNSSAVNFDGGAGDDLIYGSEHNDSIYGDAGNDTIYGYAGNDYIDVGAGDDLIYGGDGNDEIRTSGGNNLIYGENGNDYIWAHHGNDTIYGGSGNDNISGQKGDDIIFAEEGNDSITSGLEGYKIYDGGAGNDSISGSKNGGIIYGGTGSDEITGYKLGAAGTIIYGCGSAEPYYNTLTGKFTYQEITNESDRIELTAGIVDTLVGGGGNDTIYAGATKNILTGGKGDDIIYGYSGGNNTFNFTTGHGNDTIYTGTSGKNYDIMKFTNVALADISLELNGADAVVKYSENDSVTVKNFAGNLMFPVYVEDKDGNRTLLSALYSMDVPDDELQKNTIEATLPISWNVTSGIDKTIYCGAGNDTIHCGRNDTIYGGDGTNTYLVTYSVSTNGSLPTTTIVSTSNKDILVFRDGDGNIVNANSISYTRPSGTADLQIRFTVTGELYEQGRNVILKDYFNNPINLTIRTLSGDMDLYSQIKEKGGALNAGFHTGNSNAFTSSYNTIIGGSGVDKITSTKNGTVKAFGGDGDDTIDCSGTTGTKYIYGGNGADSLMGGSNINYIYGTSATKDFSKGTSAPTDTLVGGDNTDFIYSYGENAIMRGGKENDTYEAYLSNIVKIEDSEGTNTNIKITRPNDGASLNVDEIHFGYQGSIIYDANTNTLSLGGNGILCIYDAENYLKWKNINYDTRNGYNNSANALARIEISKETLENGVINPYNYLTISNSDNQYMLSRSDIKDFLQDIASWMSTNASSYGSVEEVISAHNKGKIDASALIAIFDDFHLSDYSGMA